MKKAQILIILLFALLHAVFAQETPISMIPQSTRRQELWATNPAFKVTLPQNAINYIVAAAVPVLTKKLQALAIPDVSGSTKTPIGSIAYSLSQIQLNSLQLGTDTMQITTNGLIWSMQGATGAMHLNWRWKKEHGAIRPSDHGSADVHLGMNIEFNIVIQYNPSVPSRMQVSVQNFKIHFFKFDLKLHGGASWLYNIFIKEFRGSIERQVEKSIESQVTKNVNAELAKVLASLDLNFPLGHTGIDADFNFRSVKFLPQQYMSFGLAGEFHYKSTTPFPGEPSVMPDVISSPASMIQFFVNQWMLNNVGDTMYRSGRLHKTLTQKDIPEKIPIQLNTTFFRLMLPKLYDLYPNCAMGFYFLAGNTSQTPPMKSPSFHISNQGVASIMEATTSIQVAAPNGTIVDAIVLNLVVDSDAKFYVVNQTALTGTFSLRNMTMSLKHSIIGPVDISLLQATMLMVTNYVIVPMVNQMLQDGIPLPIPKMKEFHLQGTPQVDYADQFMGIQANFTLTP